MESLRIGCTKFASSVILHQANRSELKSYLMTIRFTSWIYKLKCSLKFASKASLRNKSLFQKTFQFAQIFASIHTCPCPCPSPCPRQCSCMTMTVSVYMLCMDIYMQHGRRHTALAWTCSMDIQRKHEHRHAVWTRTTRLQHRYGQLDIQRGQDINTAWRWTIGCETWI